MCAVAPEGTDDRNHQKWHASKFRIQRSKSLGLGPNASGPSTLNNPQEFFQPRKNANACPKSSDPYTTWVNTSTLGWVTHTSENPVWNLDGYCYLAAINQTGLESHQWPKYPTMYSMSHFHYKYRKFIGFSIYKTTDTMYHIELDLNISHTDGWSEIDCIALDKLSHHLRIGGEGLTSKLKEFDGTNYQEWAQKMEAYLKTQELWYYVNGTIKRPYEIEHPADPVPAAGSTTILKSVMDTYEAKMKIWKENFDKVREWDLANDKSLGIIQLKMADKMQYL